jgi:hypothetical protein
MKDEMALNILRGMINQCTQDKEAPRAQQVVNQVQTQEKDE